VTTDTENKPAIDPEQAAELAALNAAANAAEPVQPGEAQPAQQGPTLEQEITAMLTMVAGMVKPALPSVAGLYPPVVCETIGKTLGAVCDKHGWLQSGIGGKYGEEIMCLVILGPLAWATVEAAKTDIAARAPKKPDESAAVVTPAIPSAASDDTAKTVRFG
jgi:hypothetical protein